MPPKAPIVITLVVAITLGLGDTSMDNRDS